MFRQFIRLSRADFSKKLGVAPTTYSNYELRAASIPSDVEHELALLGLNLNWLKSGHGDMIDHTRNHDLAVGYRIYKLRLENKWTERDLARLVGGVDYLKISAWELGLQEVPIEKAWRLAELFKTTHQYILTGSDELTVNEKQYDYDVVRRIPILGKVGAGFPSHVEGDILDWLTVPGLPKDDVIFSLQVKGESMMPTYKDGDYVLFRPASVAENGQAVIVTGEWNDTMIKRFRQRNGDTLFVSENPEYPSFTTQQVRLIGVVIEGWRKIRG